MVVDSPLVRRKEPHEILKSDVRQLSSADQLFGVDLTWLHMRPLYDPRSVDKRAESPTLVKGLAQTLKNLEIGTPLLSERKDPPSEEDHSAGSLPTSLKRRSTNVTLSSTSKPLKVLSIQPGELYNVDSLDNAQRGNMDKLHIGQLESVKKPDNNLNMEFDQYKVPGKKTMEAPLKRRGTLGTVDIAQTPSSVSLKSPEPHFAESFPADHVRGTAGQVAQHGYSMFGVGPGEDGYESEDDYVTIDHPVNQSDLLDVYLGEVQRTGPAGKAGAKGNPVHVADNILQYGLHPNNNQYGLFNGHPSLTPATSTGSIRSRVPSRADSVSSGPLSETGSLGNLAWNRGPNASAGSGFGSNNALTPANSQGLNINLNQASPGSFGYPYGTQTPTTPGTPGTEDGRSPGLHRASVYLPQQDYTTGGGNGMFEPGFNGYGSIADSLDELSKKDCFLCKEKLQNAPIISTNDGHWHEECFVCVQCFQPFKDPNDPNQESIFYEHDDRPYCHNCYTVNFAPMCFTCGGWVIGRVIEALDVKWHPECFGCYMCGAELCEKGFFKHNGRPICIDCHDLLKKKKKYICNKCFTPIEEYVLWYLVEPYHPYHFSCQNCFKPLDNKYRDKDGAFYCQLCWDTVIQDVCAACKHTIEGRAIKAASKAWCPHHFVCYHCERPLSGDKFMLNEGKPYCQFHYMKMFGVRCFYCDSRSSMQVIKVLNKNFCENHFFCAGCDTLLEEKKSKVIEMDMKPYCRHCYDKFPADMRRKLLEMANNTANKKKGTQKKDKKGTQKKKKDKKEDKKNIVNATETAS